MEHRVRPRECDICGATLVVSTVGGYSVIMDGDYIGFIHASLGDRWNTYSRVPHEEDQHLGKFVQTEAVRRIILASGRTPRAAA